MRNFKICLIAVYIAFIAACGGGGGGDSGGGSNGKAFYAVTGVKNGGPYIVCIDASYEDPQSANGKAVSQSIVNYYGLTGSYTVLSGTGESCKEKYPLANTVISTTFYNSTVSGAQPSASGGATTSGSSGSGTAGSNLYRPIAGNANGYVVIDANGEQFAIRDFDQRLVYQPNSTAVALDITVDTLGVIFRAGKRFGYISAINDSNGQKIAALFCENLSRLATDVSNGSANLICGTSAGGASTTGAAGTTGTPGNTGTGATAPAFITWSNSKNGVVVLDDNNERFAFNIATRCMYSYNTQTETPNFCLGSQNSGMLNDLPFAVILVAAEGGGCIAALLTLDGKSIDISTTSDGRQLATATNNVPNGAGCSG